MIRRQSFLPLALVCHILIHLFFSFHNLLTLLGVLGRLLLVKERRVLAALSANTAILDHVIKTNLPVDLAHSLSVRLGDTDGAEDDVHLFKRQPFCFRDCEMVSHKITVIY